MRHARIAIAGAAAAAVLALAACGGVDSGGSSGAESGAGGGGADAGGLKGQQAVFVLFEADNEEPFKQAFADPVAKATGLRVTFDVPTDYAKVQAQAESGNVSWTVLEADPWWALAHCGELVEKLDMTGIEVPQKFGSGDCAVPGNTFAFNYSYDGKKFAGDPPKGWTDFFDTARYPGKRAVWGSYAVNGIIEGALLADGVTPEQLYPLDLDRAFKKLDTIKGDLVFYDTLAQALEMMQSNAAAMVVATNIPGGAQAERGGSFKPVWNQALLSWDAYIVPKGGNVKAAHALLVEIAKPEAQAKLAESTAFGPVSPDAKPNLSADQKEWSAGNEANASQAVPMDQQWYADHFDELTERYTAWVSG
jgi:putative spermidine/putrescine transport system substrate-binding protein